MVCGSVAGFGSNSGGGGADAASTSKVWVLQFSPLSCTAMLIPLAAAE